MSRLITFEETFAAQQGYYITENNSDVYPATTTCSIPSFLSAPWHNPVPATASSTVFGPSSEREVPFQCAAASEPPADLIWESTPFFIEDSVVQTKISKFLSKCWTVAQHQESVWSGSISERRKAFVREWISDVLMRLYQAIDNFWTAVNLQSVVELFQYLLARAFPEQLMKSSKLGIALEEDVRPELVSEAVVTAYKELEPSVPHARPRGPSYQNGAKTRRTGQSWQSRNGATCCMGPRCIGSGFEILWDDFSTGEILCDSCWYKKYPSNW